MARRLSTITTASVKKTINPYSQPCFATYTMHHSHGGGYYLYDHNLNLISADHGTGDSSYGSFRTYSTSASQFFESSNSYPDIQTDDTPSQSTNRGSGLNYVGYLGHISHLRAGVYGNFGGWNCSGNQNGSEYRAYAFRDVAPIVNETHQDYAIFSQHNSTTGTLLHVGQRSATMYYNKIFNGTWGGRVNIPAASSNGRGMHGSVCYNRKTRKLLVMESNGSYGLTPVIWNNVPDLRLIAHNRATEEYKTLGDSYTAHTSNVGYLHDYFQNTANRTVYTVNSFNTNTYSSTQEANLRCIPVLNDDDSVTVFQMTPGDGCLVYKWSSAGAPSGVLYRGSWTTSYGYEQGIRFGARWQVTSDGKYLFGYCPSYYYGSGAYISAIRVSDGKFLRFTTQDQTYGRSCCPIGKSDMMWVYSANTNSGNGLYYRTVNLPHEFAIRNDGAIFNLDSHWMNTTLECGTYSTAYPYIIPALYDTALFTEPHLPSIS